MFLTLELEVYHARQTARFATWAYAIAIAAGLLFGARQALASTSMFACMNDGYNYLGACVSIPDCTERCQLVGSSVSMGSCYGQGCCRCFH